MQQDNVEVARNASLTEADPEKGRLSERALAEAEVEESDVPIDDAIRTYLREIGRVPLLSEEQERALGSDLHQGNVEIARAIRSLHARTRAVLLERDSSLLTAAAVAWAPLLGQDADVLEGLFGTLLMRRGRDDEEVGAIGGYIDQAIRERDNWRGGLESLFRALVDDDARVVSSVIALAALERPAKEIEDAIESLKEHVTLEAREVGVGEEGETETILLPRIDGLPYQEHPAAQAATQLLGLGHSEADRLFEMVQSTDVDTQALASAFASLLDVPLKRAQAALKGWTVSSELVQRAQRARGRLTESNLRLVVSVAKKYVGRGLPLLDLVQEGNFGLMRATELFDPSLGYRFSTYAIWWIRQSVLRGISTQGRAVRLPVHVQQRLSLIARTRRELTFDLGREPTHSELAKRLNVTEERLSADMLAGQEIASLETPVGDDQDSSTLSEFVEDESAPDIGESVARNMLRSDLDRALESLTEREQEVVRLRYGMIPDGRARSLDEIGARFGISRERARQIEARAMQKLRRPAQSRQLRAYAT